MRILVTGHRGYLGTVLAPVLAAAGHDVVGLDSGLFEGCSLGPEPPELAEAVRKDVRDVDAGDLAGVEAVVHLAALANDPLGDLDPALTDEVNRAAAVELAARAREAGVRRFVFSSTCSVYGRAGAELVDEGSPLRPVTAYARAKARAERELSRLADERFSPTHLRSATVYGASPRLRGDLVVNNLAGHAHATGRVQVRSDGTPWRPVVHVCDVAAAFLAVLEAPLPLVHDRVLNVGRTDENFRVAELAGAVADAVPGAAVEYAAGGGPDRRSYRVSLERLAALPGFRPAWSLRRGVADLLALYRDAGLDLADLEGPRLQRLARVEELMAEGVVDARLRAVGAALARA